MKRPDEVTELLCCGGVNCDNTCATMFDRLGVEDCKTWRVHGYVQQLEERVVHLEALNQSNLSVITMQERTRARLEEQISQLESCVPRWISVDERLPEDGKNVLVHVTNPAGWWNVDVDWRTEGGWAVNADSDWHIVTHWMPLPQPPEEPA